MGWLDPFQCLLVTQGTATALPPLSAPTALLQQAGGSGWHMAIAWLQRDRASIVL